MNRWICTSRASSTRARTASEVSPAASEDSSLSVIEGTSMWRSIRSRAIRDPCRSLLEQLVIVRGRVSQAGVGAVEIGPYTVVR